MTQCIANNKLRCPVKVCPFRDSVFLEDLEFYLTESPIQSPTGKATHSTFRRGKVLKRTVIGTLLAVPWWDNHIPKYLEEGRIKITHKLCRELRRAYYKWLVDVAPAGHKVKLPSRAGKGSRAASRSF